MKEIERVLAYIPKVYKSESSLVIRFITSKDHYTEGSLDRGFSGQKIVSSGDDRILYRL